jgi:hypothetical protein
MVVLTTERTFCADVRRFMFRATFAGTTKLAVDVFRRVENEKLQNMWAVRLTDIVADDIDGTSP